MPSGSIIIVFLLLLSQALGWQELNNNNKRPRYQAPSSSTPSEQNIWTPPTSLQLNHPWAQPQSTSSNKWTGNNKESNEPLGELNGHSKEYNEPLVITSDRNFQRIQEPPSSTSGLNYRLTVPQSTSSESKRQVNGNSKENNEPFGKASTSSIHQHKRTQDPLRLSSSFKPYKYVIATPEKKYSFSETFGGAAHHSQGEERKRKVREAGNIFHTFNEGFNVKAGNRYSIIDAKFTNSLHTSRSDHRKHLTVKVTLRESAGQLAGRNIQATAHIYETGAGKLWIPAGFGRSAEEIHVNVS
jgi:hypothetical protein